MTEQYLWIAGSLPFLILGTIHLLYTFFSQKLTPRDRALQEEMRNAYPVLTKETTMWKAWVGFNSSHSSGAMYIGLTNLLLALRFFSVITDPIFLCINMITVLFYLWLAKTYWFSIPFKGMMISAACFAAGTLIIIFK